MPLTTQQFRSMSPQDIVANFSRKEIEAFLSPEAPEVSDPGFGNRGSIWDVTPVNEQEDFLSADNLGRAAGNIIPSAVNVGRDVANVALHPLDTARGLYDAGPSGILSALGERFGNIKKTAVEDPFGLALDVAPVGAAVGGVAKAGKLGGTAARIAQTASALNPATAAVRGAAGIAKKAGSAAGGGAALAASLLTGVPRPVLSAARKAETGSAAQRAAFRTARKRTDDVQAVPQGIESTIKTLKEERSRIFKQSQDQLQGQNITASNRQLDEFRTKFEADLESEFGVSSFDEVDTKARRQAADLGIEAEGTPTLDFEDVGGLRESPAAVKGQLNRAFRRVMDSNGEVGELWKARQDIDRIAERAVGARASKVEAAIFTNMRSNVTDLLEELGGPEFRELNASYRQATELIDDFQDVTAAGGGKKGQISAVQGAVGDSDRFTSNVLSRAEEGGGAPLTATGAGGVLSETAAAGLIGKNKLAQAVFAGTAAFAQPQLLVPILLTNPKTIGSFIEYLGVPERIARELLTATRKITNLPGAKPLIEQGFTFGAILQQLEREGISTEGGFLSAVGRARGAADAFKTDTFGAPLPQELLRRNATQR